MSDLFRVKRRGEMLRLSRPVSASYETANGDTVVAPPNVPRYEHKDGYLYGLKVGDGDSASIPLTPDEAWGIAGGTLVTTTNAPVNSEILVSGDVSVVGFGAMKTQIYHLAPTERVGFSVDVYPNGDILNEDEEAHVLIVKYYKDQIDFSQYEEHEAMVELNDFMHAAWS